MTREVTLTISGVVAQNFGATERLVLRMSALVLILVAARWEALMADAALEG